jgi:hypothetical protein
MEDIMADTAKSGPKKITKPDGMSTYKELTNMQEAYLHGVSHSFVEKNSEFINSIASMVQGITARYNQTIASTSPQYLIDSVKAKVSKQRLDAAAADTTKQGFVTGVKGLTDLSKDMDLFRELYPLATPMFELFYEYQMVFGMIPEAAKCFDILKNAVLSADSFSKQYLVARYDSYKLGQELNVLNESVEKHTRLIKDIVDEYDLNIIFDKYTADGMMFGAKPVMLIPIDETFRKSAEMVLKAESADDVRKIIKGAYSDGTKVSMEASFEDTEFTAEGSVDTFGASNRTEEFDKQIDELIVMYEDALDYEISMIDFENKEQSAEKIALEKVIKDRQETIKRAKKKSNRKEVMKEMARIIDKMVDTKVKFDVTQESVPLKQISKIAGQLKTYRRSKQKKINKGVTLENVIPVYEGNDIQLESDVELICKMAHDIKYEKKESKNADGTTFESYQMVMPDMLSYEDELDMTKSSRANKTSADDLATNLNVKSTVSKKTTGSVIVPLAPDSVVPIAVHGKHIGYYIIERLGSDDLGSGVATLLGYKPPNSMYSMGMAGHMYTGNGTMTGTDGAGVIIRDMTDLPMNVRDDGQRIDLLRSMLVRAISERVGNPDIVDDSAFNSIIFSLIKDNYITKREIRITYVPAHMMVYFAHEIDQDSGIGVSVAKNGLFFAHVYVASLITNLMIAISKSADREQVNVEVGSNGRIEATVQKVMRSLQTKRASIDSIGNIDTIMRSLGTFQRYISLRHNGTPLVELETIPGQDVDLENSLMDKALKSFVNSFYVPSSAINQLDETEYARSITLQNALFLDRVVMLQLKYQDCMSKFVRALIRNKFPEKILKESNINRVQENAEKKVGDITNVQDLIDLDKVYVDLPSPEGLNISAFNDQIQNVGSFSDSIIDILVPLGIAEDQVESVKVLIKRGLFEKYLTNLPFDEFDKIAKDAQVKVQESKLAHPEVPEDQQYGGDGAGGSYSSSSSGGDMGGGGFGDMGDMGGGEDLGGDMGAGEETPPEGDFGF